MDACRAHPRVLCLAAVPAFFLAALAPVAHAQPAAPPSAPAAPSAAAASAPVPGAPAEPAPSADFIELSGAFEAGHLSEALRLATAYVAAHPDDATGFYYLGAGRLQTMDLDAALAAFDRCIELAPQVADCHTQKAQGLYVRGDLVAAQAAVDRALALAPDDELARTVAADLAIDARIQSGQHPALADGSPARFVDEVLTAVSRSGAVALKRYADLSRLPAEARDDFAAILRGVGEAWDKQLTGRGNRYLGYEVNPASTVDGDESLVEVSLLIARVLTHDQVAQLRTVVNDAELRAVVDPNLLFILDGLDPADRDAFLARMRSVNQRMVLPLTFEVTGPPGAYRVLDLRVGATRISDTLPTMIKRYKSPGTNLAYKLGILVGTALAAIIAFLLIRRLRGL